MTVSKLACKCHEDKARSFSLNIVPSPDSHSQRELSRASWFQKSSDLGKKKYSVCPQWPVLPKPPLGCRAERRNGKKNSSHRGSWPKTLAPDGISAGSIQQQLSSKKWLRFSGPTLWLVDEMNQEGIEDRWCGQKGKEEKQKRGRDGGHIPNLLLGWKFSSNTTTTGYS